jgi:hypothetical protein
MNREKNYRVAKRHVKSFMFLSYDDATARNFRLRLNNLLKNTHLRFKNTGVLEYKKTFINYQKKITILFSQSFSGNEEFCVISKLMEFDDSTKESLIPMLEMINEGDFK